MTLDEKERNLYWAEKFEEEASSLEKGPNTMPGKQDPVLIKACIAAYRSIATDLKNECEKLSES